MAADQGLIDSVANENNKVGAGGPAFWMNGLMQNHVGHLAVLNQIQQSAAASFVQLNTLLTGKLGQLLIEMEPGEAMANAVLGQQGTKTAQSTPPETAKPG